LIEENHGSRWKSFPPCGSYSRLRVGLAEFARVRNGLQLIEQAAIEQYQESESCRLQHLSFATPGVGPRAGRMVEPETRVGECLAKNLQILIAGIIIAVKAQI
jgi:hypothetical protein